MARTPKQSQLWTVRNRDGSLVGAFYAYTAKQAIDRAVAETQAYHSTFKGRTRISAADLIATVEGEK